MIDSCRTVAEDTPLYGAWETIYRGECSGS
jgi:hypothetical protein